MESNKRTLADDYNDAIEAGDLDALRALYQNERNLFGNIIGKDLITPRVWATTLNAAKRDPIKLQRDVLLRILSLQATLLERVETGIRDSIAEHDDRGYPHSQLPNTVSCEMLPRYGKLASEIYVTMKMLKKIEAPSIPGGENVNEPADDADEPAQSA